MTFINHMKRTSRPVLHHCQLRPSSLRPQQIISGRVLPPGPEQTRSILFQPLSTTITSVAIQTQQQRPCQRNRNSVLFVVCYIEYKCCCCSSAGSDVPHRLSSSDPLIFRRPAHTNSSLHHHSGNRGHTASESRTKRARLSHRVRRLARNKARPAYPCPCRRPAI